MLTRNDIHIPKSWGIIAGADTGTYMGGAIAAVSPGESPTIVVLEEFPNYHYTGDGTIELVGMTVGEWVRWFGTAMRSWTKERRNSAWVDANTTFKTEVGHGFRFRMNHKDLELRTEITREYLRNGRLLLMPWLDIIPYEMEEASFPEHETAGTGKYRRIKRKDHCLDGVEHICSRHPSSNFKPDGKTRQSAIDELLVRNRHIGRPEPEDPYLGAQ